MYVRAFALYPLPGVTSVELYSFRFQNCIA